MIAKLFSNLLILYLNFQVQEEMVGIAGPIRHIRLDVKIHFPGIVCGLKDEILGIKIESVPGLKVV